MNLNELPDNLPVPVDDGACDHLESTVLPDISLLSTNGTAINIRDFSKLLVLYIYPMTGRPDKPLPDGWDEIPGARGCTPQSCSFRDSYSAISAHEAEIYGVSTQDTSYQLEVKERLHLPFDLLSDENLQLKKQLKLPTFEAANMELYKRITLICRNGIIEKVFYPVFPPSDSANTVLKWLTSNVKT